MKTNKVYKIEFSEFEFMTIIAATMFYCSYMQEKTFNMKNTEKLCKKLLKIKDEEPF